MLERLDLLFDVLKNSEDGNLRRSGIGQNVDRTAKHQPPLAVRQDRASQPRVVRFGSEGFRLVSLRLEMLREPDRRFGPVRALAQIRPGRPRREGRPDRRNRGMACRSGRMRNPKVGRQPLPQPLRIDVEQMTRGVPSCPSESTLRGLPSRSRMPTSSERLVPPTSAARVLEWRDEFVVSVPPRASSTASTT